MSGDTYKPDTNEKHTTRGKLTRMSNMSNIKTHY